jgi:hypothetical protein
MSIAMHKKSRRLKLIVVCLKDYYKYAIAGVEF